MADMRSRWDHYYKRAKDVYEKEGINSFLTKGWSFSFLLINKQFWKIRHNSKASILNHDWDNLLIFDACRYDDFCEIAPYDQDRINPRQTVGSNTEQFLKKTFSEEQLHDTVYITANPQFFKHWDDLNEPNVVFHDTVSVIDEWDADLGTVTPESVVKHARECHAKYPNKRLLIHFNQPHYPFIGSTAKSIREKTNKTIGGSAPMDHQTDDFEWSEEDRFPSYVDAINAGISRKRIRTAYRESIDQVIKRSQPLIDELPGKTVITADHGEHLGDRPVPFGGRLWGHPPGVRSTALCVVPWVEFDFDNRKGVTTDPPQAQSPVDNQVVDQRLRALGYR